MVQAGSVKDGVAMVTNDYVTKPPVLPGIDENSVVLIAGGSGAIGSHCAAALSKMGARVAITGRSQDRVKECVQSVRYGGDVVGLVADVSSSAQVNSAVSSVAEKWGRIDGLVNLAAIGDSGRHLEEVDDSEIAAVLNTNLVGAIYLARACTSVMKQRTKGSIVNVSSIGGHRVTPHRITYGPAKAALEHLSRQLSVDLGRYGIRVNTMSPGQTPSNLRRFNESPGLTPITTDPEGNPTPTKRIPLCRRGKFEDYVGAVLFLLSDLASYVTGVNIWVDGGASVVR